MHRQIQEKFRHLPTKDQVALQPELNFNSLSSELWEIVFKHVSKNYCGSEVIAKYEAKFYVL